MGDIEPVFWQGIECGHIRKFLERLMIEMLRAHVPGKFKSPGVNVQVNQDNKAAFVVDPATQDALIEKRRLALQRIKEAECQGTAEGVKQTRPRGILER